MRLAYFDHNVLDALLKGRADAVRPVLDAANMTPVYSDENINEIIKSVGRENEFLSLLEELDAQRVFEEIVDFKFTGNILCSNQAASERFAEIKEGIEGDASEYDGIDFLRKYYGGVQNQSFQQTLLNPLLEQKRILEASLIEPEYISDEDIKRIEETLELIPSLVSELTSASVEIDNISRDSQLVEEMENHIKHGPVQLNNIEPPAVLPQIWELIGQYFGAPDRSLDAFFGIGMDLSSLNLGDREQRIVDVNSVINQLNLIGYHRDTKLSDEQKFSASWSDASHAGYASLCNLFFCNDKRLRKKVIAAFEHLNIKVPIIQINSKKVTFHAKWMEEQT